jgi:hypothetical protein
MCSSTSRVLALRDARYEHHRRAIDLQDELAAGTGAFRQTNTSSTKPSRCFSCGPALHNVNRNFRISR